VEIGYQKISGYFGKRAEKSTKEVDTGANHGE